MRDDGTLERETRYVTVGDARIYYQAVGRGTPVVLVHGLSGSSRWWGRNVPTLARHHRVYVVDLVQFGRSRGHRFVLSEAAEYLRRWMDVVGVERADVVGHSMGGYIAADLAALHPERVARLVLVDAAALPPGQSPMRTTLDLFHAVRTLPPTFFPLLVTDALRAGPRTLLKAGRELLTSDLTGRLHEIQAPTLVIWGENDRAVPLEIGEAIARQVAHARLEVIPAAGHNPMWDRPRAFNDLLTAFLAAPTDSPPSASRDARP